MFYITFNNFNKLLLALELDIPKLYESEFYAKYKSQFGLNLDYFSRREAKSVVIAQMLVEDFTGAMMRIQIERTELSQQEWVETVVTPCYHFNNECELLKADFNNVRIPDSVVQQGRSEEYRQYYFENKEKLHSQIPSEVVEAIYALKSKFDLSEESEEIQRKYIRETHYKNSEVAEFNASLNFQKEAQEIRKLSDAFNLYVRPINPLKSKRSSFIYDEKMRAMFFKQNELDLIKKLHEKKKEISLRIMNFYFQTLQQQNKQFTEKFLQLAGLRLCTYCKTSHPKHSHGTAQCESFDDIPF